jgi:hypothetical protein
MVIGIHQPNFFPWFGYFLKIIRSDIFVFLDNVQIVQTGGSFTNRTYLNIHGNSKYFTAPIKRIPGKQLINETHFANDLWQKKLKGTLQINYSKVPFYKQNIDLLHYLIDYHSKNLSDFNINAIKTLSEYLNIRSTFVLSSSLKADGTATERLTGIIKCLGGDTYLSGMGAEKYQQDNIFKNYNIKLIFNEFDYPLYNQLNTVQFIKGLSIIDMLLNAGKDGVQEFLRKLR